MPEILRQDFFNTKNVEERISEMLKDWSLSPEERREILNVWHLFRKSKDKTILEAREKLREFAIKNKYFGFSEKLYTESWARSYNETQDEENKRLKKARGRVSNVKNINSLSDEELAQTRALEQLNNSLRQTSEKLKTAEETLKEKEQAKNGINTEEIQRKKTAFETAKSNLEAKNKIKATYNKKQTEYNNASDEDKETLLEWLEQAKLEADKITQEEIKLSEKTKNDTEREYKDALKEEKRINDEFDEAKATKDKLKWDLDATLTLRQAASDEILKAKNWKEQAKKKEQKLQIEEVADAERKNEE